jgi:hypothetical protein
VGKNGAGVIVVTDTSVILNLAWPRDSARFHVGDDLRRRIATLAGETN